MTNAFFLFLSGGGPPPTRSSPGRWARVGGSRQGAGDFQDAFARLPHIEDALHHGGGVRVQFQGGTFLGPVLDTDPLIAIGYAGSHPEAASRSFAHSPDDLLGQILRVELVHALDDGLHELADGESSACSVMEIQG